jgi:large subunit ribosomal protein L22
MPYAYNPDPKKSARAYGRGLAISTSGSAAVCRAISGMRTERGRALLQELLDRKRSLSGRYYTKAAREILAILKSAEGNAEGRGLDPEKLHIHASAHQGFTFFRPRGWKRRRERRKSTNLQIVLEAR